MKDHPRIGFTDGAGDSAEFSAWSEDDAGFLLLATRDKPGTRQVIVELSKDETRELFNWLGVQLHK